MRTFGSDHKAADTIIVTGTLLQSLDAGDDRLKENTITEHCISQGSCVTVSCKLYLPFYRLMFVQLDKLVHLSGLQ